MLVPDREPGRSVHRSALLKVPVISYLSNSEDIFKTFICPDLCPSSLVNFSHTSTISSHWVPQPCSLLGLRLLQGFFLSPTSVVLMVMPPNSALLPDMLSEGNLPCCPFNYHVGILFISPIQSPPWNPLHTRQPHLGIPSSLITNSLLTHIWNPFLPTTFYGKPSNIPKVYSRLLTLATSSLSPKPSALPGWSVSPLTYSSSYTWNIANLLTGLSTSILSHL